MYVENGFLILPNNLKFKKITATKFYGLLGRSKFDKRGDTFLQMYNLYKKPFDPYYTKRGAIAEAYLEDVLKSLGKEIIKWNSREIKFDNFPTVEHFGGLIDFMEISPETVIYECKSKSAKDYDYLSKHNNEEQEYQALFYGYLANVKLIRMAYVFFTEEQESKIKQNIDISNEVLNVLIKDITYDETKFKTLLNEALTYVNLILNTGRISLTDISENVLREVIR